MTVPNERDDEMLRALFSSGAEKPQVVDHEFNEAFAAYQKVEALFDLLRRPADGVEAHTADHIAPGKVLGEFAILRPLASGGMGQVYLARQESLGRLVALKVCKPEIARDPRTKSRFIAEALSLAQLTHPNVVPVLSTGEDQGYLYLAMEYVAGPTLAQVLQAIEGARPDSLASAVVARVLASPGGDCQSQPWEAGHAILDRAYQTWAVQALQQVAQGLAAAHSAGILHRDIKPANIIFAANGVPKIVDFGLARTSRAPSATVIGEFYGTPAYTSPEQARGEGEAVRPWSDVFSFGATLFECLSLARPFPGRTSVDVLNAVLNSDATLLRQVEKRIPPELEAITDKCLRKNPAERYPSAYALADDLRNYLELRPVSARPPSRIGRVGRMIRRRPWVAAFLFTLVGAAALGALVARRAWADYRAEKIKTFNRRVDDGDTALFRCLMGQRPTWLPAVIEKYRQQGIDAYSAALEFDPNAVRPLVQRARLFASKKETLDLALADLDKAQQLQPGFGSIRKFRGFVLDELGRKEDGQAAMEDAKSLYPTTTEDLYWLGVIAHSKEEDFLASYDYFSRALLLTPNDYWSRLERAYFGRIQSEEGAAVGMRVIPELEIAKTIRPDLPFASEFLAKFYSTDRADTLEGSRQKRELAEQIERFGLDIPRAHDMSVLLQSEKKFDEAKSVLQPFLDQDTGGRTAEQIGHLEYRVGHYEQARAWYQRAISEGARYPIAYMELANAFTAMKNWKAAERAYLDGIAEHPKHAFLYWNLGSWYEQRGQLADAERTYRKGCALPCDLPESAPAVAASASEYSLERDVAMCYRNLAHLLFRLGRSENVQVLERGLSQLTEKLRSIRKDQPQKTQSFEREIFELKGDLGQAYVLANRRQNALSLIDSELKKKPLKSLNASTMINLLRLLGMGQAALEVARLAEFTTQRDAPPSDPTSRLLARRLVERQLQELGLFKELLDRLETRRAFGKELDVLEYSYLGMNYQGAEAVAILGEAIKKYPDSVGLHSDYMHALAKAGRKAEAWKVYQQARDLYFAKTARSNVPASPGSFEIDNLSPAVRAQAWYTFLLQEGRQDEFVHLEELLRGFCAKTMTDADQLWLPRATAEFAAHNYARAVKSLETCLEKKLGNEAAIVAALARSLRALGQREDAIKRYRRAVQLSGVDSGLLSEFLCLVVEVQGVEGLQRELPGFDQAWLRLNVRLNATLSCFSSWAAVVTGNEKVAFELSVVAGPYILLASQQPGFDADEGLVCGVINQIVLEKLADSRRLVGATEFLKRFPAERVTSMKAVFSLPSRK